MQEWKVIILQWRHNGRDGVSNHQPHDCFNSTVYSGADQRKHPCSASLAFVRGIHRGPVNSPHKWPVTRKMLPFDDVIMRWPVCSGSAWDGTQVTSNEPVGLQRHGFTENTQLKEEPAVDIFASISCCKRTFYCNDSKITEFETIDTKNSSTAYVVMYKLIT